jgi:hypothetical protein
MTGLIKDDAAAGFGDPSSKTGQFFSRQEPRIAHPSRSHPSANAGTTVVRKSSQESETFDSLLDCAPLNWRGPMACKYRMRMLKYESKLFTFLDHDDVPWNNNNAENAMMHFVGRRKVLGSAYSAKSLQGFLLFFSIYQTCRNKGLSFLPFLRSGLTDIDAFADGAHR